MVRLYRHNYSSDGGSGTAGDFRGIYHDSAPNKIPTTKAVLAIFAATDQPMTRDDVAAALRATGREVSFPQLLSPILCRLRKSGRIQRMATMPGQKAVWVAVKGGDS